MLAFKPEVRIGYCQPCMWRVLDVASRWSLTTRLDVIVTSLNDPAPGRVADTLHPFDLAIDLEPVNRQADTRRDLAERFRRELDPAFVVLLETDHIHVQWDAHRPDFPAPAPAPGVIT
jgi:hypothetical protein